MMQRLVTLACVAALAPAAALADLRLARRLDDGNATAVDFVEDDVSFLSDYQWKLIRCAKGELYVNPENGEFEYNSVVFRLCPKDSCDDTGRAGCTSGNGDYVVGLNTFVKQYVEDQRDLWQQDDDAFPDIYGECSEYVPDDTEEGEVENPGMYFVGPACTDDGTDIQLDLFSEENCVVQSEEPFEGISNGLSLPFANGGLVSSYCEPCARNNGTDVLPPTAMCRQLYASSGKCETNMEWQDSVLIGQEGSSVERGRQRDIGYPDKDDSSCEHIAYLLSSTSGPHLGSMTGWLLLATIHAFRNIQ